MTYDKINYGKDFSFLTHTITRKQQYLASHFLGMKVNGSVLGGLFLVRVERLSESETFRKKKRKHR